VGFLPEGLARTPFLTPIFRAERAERICAPVCRRRGAAGLFRSSAIGLPNCEGAGISELCPKPKAIGRGRRAENTCPIYLPFISCAPFDFVFGPRMTSSKTVLAGMGRGSALRSLRWVADNIVPGAGFMVDDGRPQRQEGWRDGKGPGGVSTKLGGPRGGRKSFFGLDAGVLAVGLLVNRRRLGPSAF